MNKANKNLKIVGIFFFIIGLFYIALYVGCNILVEKVGNRIKTDAVVEKVSYNGIDIVYHVDGEELRAHLNEDQEDYHKGKKIKVYYDRNNHNDVFTIGFLDDISSLLCGFILIGIGLIFFIKYFKNDKKYKRLMLNGTIVSARIVNISRVGTSYIINCEFYSRIYNFLKVYDEVFVGKKHIIMKTDNIDLFADSLVYLSNYGYILNDVSLDLHNKDIFNVKTEYEEKFSEKGYKINYLDATKD